MSDFNEAAERAACEKWADAQQGWKTNSQTWLARARLAHEENARLRKQGKHVSELQKLRDALEKKNKEHHELRARILELENTNAT